ncbi:MAG: UDP-N-acetylmuramoyl-L-alanine--D-glutamate ligase [Candidatus Paceibacterota bacterium]|jgi:UDP-N-acetylmuramoylalanine--D-glutamate ligase|nr:UDP-N-acetylmuramoyl-L-alanine--D-glutamate ligase [Candidatus Paceibacterota bacterium]
MNPKEFLKDKRALVMGLGLLGGGVATSKWLIKHGAKVTVTDSKNEVELAPSLEQFTEDEKKSLTLSLGGHREQDFKENDIIVINPAVPKESLFIAIAKKAGKSIENDASIFFRFLGERTIGVTGTRGKTTVTNWIASLLFQKYGEVRASGNTPANAFLKEFDRISKTDIPAVAELSSWQLETLPASGKAPHVAVITNLFPDHLNRYREGIEGYARAKANIFKHQAETDFLILNDGNPWTKFFLAQKPRSKVFYFSKKNLAKGKNGMFVKGGAIIFRNGGEEKKILDIKTFAEKMGEHNLENLLAATLAIILFDPKFKITKKMLDALPQIPFRQEIIFSKVGRTIVNDSAGTSPDAVIAILRRFKKNIVLITGGTDKDLEFKDLAKEIKKTLKPPELVLLNGSATKKLIFELEKIKFWGNPSARLRAGGKKIVLFETLEECVDFAFAATSRGKRTILFSPGSASFEKFKNEFDRGEKFNENINSRIKNKMK